MKVAVVGHIEWGKFVRVSSVPKQGEIIHSEESWEEVAGGGSVAAIQLAQLADNCLFFTAVGDDRDGKRAIKQLQDAGVEVYASITNESQTKDIFVHIDDQKERTITVTGNLKPDGNDSSLPWEKLAEVDAIYFVSGNKAALLAARQAKVLVSTARILPLLKESGVQLDALVCSKNDAGETYQNGELTVKPTIVVTTAGAEGGRVDNGIQYDAELIPVADVVDTYGCGDSFAAGLTLALGQRKDLPEALRLAAHWGAKATKRRGSFGNG